MLLSEQFHYIQHFILFQYISCYSLSVQGAAEMPWLISFNTSHVTLYLQQMVADADEVTFQHISCYSLSDQYTVKPFSNTVSIHLMLLFILETVRDHPEYSRFNTSHVTLYHIHKDLNIGNLCCFNTSHVTLYRTPCFKVQHIILVSIHLMLLFIYGDGEFYVNTIQFQYISCYSLSLVL